MCGISGFYNHRGEHLPFSILEKNAKLLHHRGPDNVGFFHNGPVGLAHNRLSLLDLSEHGNQPFEDEKSALIYNGEIYNFQELKQQLEQEHRIQFHSTSDTEILFQLLHVYGVEKTCTLIEGMFAFAYYDKLQNELFLCRDQIGIKPLFYAVENGTVFFASEYKAILPHINPVLDEARLMYSVAGILDKAKEFTVYKNIFHLQPGMFMSCRPGRQQPEIKPYFKLGDLIDPDYYASLDAMPKGQVFELFEQEMQNSVHRMLMSDAPMGAFVSGGVDSSLIAAMACRQQALTLFSTNVVGRYSEIEDARSLSRAINSPLHEFSFQPEMLITELTRCTRHMEVPIVTHTNAVPFSGVAQLAHNEGVKAVLTGEGSDELFLGYPRLLTRRYDQLLKWPFRLLTAIYNRIPGLNRYVLQNTENLLAGTLEMAVQKYQRQTLRQEETALLQHIPAADRADTYMSLQMVHEGLAALLWRNDRMGMIASIEARFPFLDEKLLKLALNLPIKYKIGRTARFHNYKHPFLIDKHIVRKTSEKYISKNLAYKTKNGFPMYGYNHLQIDKNFFNNGFWAQFLQLSTAQTKYFANSTDPYILSKFLAVEIWAKLFLEGLPDDTVSQQVLSAVKIRSS